MKQPQTAIHHYKGILYSPVHANPTEMIILKVEGNKKESYKH